MASTEAFAGVKIERPRESGPARHKDVSPHPGNTLHAADIGKLADLLGC
jgi:2-haloacid dehalogenase